MPHNYYWETIFSYTQVESNLHPPLEVCKFVHSFPLGKVVMNGSFSTATKSKKDNFCESLTVSAQDAMFKRRSESEHDELSRHPAMQTAKEDIHDDEDISTETIVAPPLEEEEDQLYDNDVPRLPVEAAEDELEDDAEEEEKFYFQKFLATRRGRQASYQRVIFGKLSATV